MKTGNVITLKKQKAIDILRKRKNTSDALAEIKKKRLPVPSIEEWRQDRLDFFIKEGRWK